MSKSTNQPEHTMAKAKKATKRKHIDAVARDRWLGSDEGKKCQYGTASGEYLRNRLVAAFMAGVNHGRTNANPKVVTVPVEG